MSSCSQESAKQPEGRSQLRSDRWPFRILACGREPWLFDDLERFLIYRINLGSYLDHVWYWPTVGAKPRITLFPQMLRKAHANYLDRNSQSNSHKLSHQQKLISRWAASKQHWQTLSHSHLESSAHWIQVWVHDRLKKWFKVLCSWGGVDLCYTDWRAAGPSQHHKA